MGDFWGKSWLYRNVAEHVKIIWQDILFYEDGGQSIGLEHVRFQKMRQDMVKSKFYRKQEWTYVDLVIW